VQRSLRPSGTDQLTNNRRVVIKSSGAAAAAARRGRAGSSGTEVRRGDWDRPMGGTARIGSGGWGPGQPAKGDRHSDRDLCVTVAGGPSAVSGWHGASARLPWPLANRSGSVGIVSSPNSASLD
jgi:hypothetical protein